MREAITSTPSSITLAEFVCMDQIHVTQFMFEVSTSKRNAMLLRDPRQRNDRIAIQRSQEGQG